MCRILYWRRCNPLGTMVEEPPQHDLAIFRVSTGVQDVIVPKLVDIAYGHQRLSGMERRKA
jgi:hypothetical protein